MDKHKETSIFFKVKTEQMIEEMPKGDTKDALKEAFEYANINHNKLTQCADQSLNNELRGIRATIKALSKDPNNE